MNKEVCFSHNTDDWRTPSDLYRLFVNKGYKDTFMYQSSIDELANMYYHSKLFVNPPYSKLNKIVEWLIKQIESNNTIYLLIPSRTDTIYFHELIKYKPNIFFIKGRLHFNDSIKSAPFPSILLEFSNTSQGLYFSCSYSDLLRYLEFTL